MWYPAASPGVTAVGGTSLVRDSSARGWAETVWAGAGSGCSRVEAKPAWQADPGCAKRAVADVSAVADPNTGVAAYDTYQAGGWQVFGGTSVASPIIAATYALAGAPHAGTDPAQYPYDAAMVDPSTLNDVTSGSNGSCQPAYLCTGGPGYDGPTGLGTPHGVGAFGYRAHGRPRRHRHRRGHEPSGGRSHGGRAGSIGHDRRSPGTTTWTCRPVATR